MTETNTCQVTLSARDRYDSFNPRKCGRPLAEGADVCSLHLKARERAEEKAENDRNARRLEQERHTQANERASALRELLGGFPATVLAEYKGFGKGGHTGGIVLNGAAADKVIAALRATAANSPYRADKITDQNVEDVMTTASYGGITYWATEPSRVDFEQAPADHHTVKEEEDGTVYYLSPDQIRQAIVEVAEGKHTNDTIRDYVRHAFDEWSTEDGIDCGDIDADAADCIVQVACFGRVVYG